MKARIRQEYAVTPQYAVPYMNIHAMVRHGVSMAIRKKVKPDRSQIYDPVRIFVWTAVYDQY